VTPLDRRPRLPRALPEARGGLIGPVRRRWLNLGLGLVLAGCVAGAYLVVGDPGTSTASTARTTTVGRGDVTASVTGTGNLESARTTSLSFGASGTVTAVAVAAGDRVTKGQLLASIDDGSAQRSLSSAQAQLASAQAAYDELTAGPSATDKEKDELAVESAELGVDSAQASLTQAKNQLAADLKAQDALVARAKAALAAGTGTQAQVNAAVSTRRQVITKDQQAVTSAQQQLLQAKSQLAQQRSTAEQNAAGPTDAEVAQARVSIETAEAGVADAQDALDGTTLRAPFAATVVSVSGSVGDAVSAGSSSSTGSSGSSGSSGSTSPSSTPSTSSSSSSASTSASSAFVVLADLGRLQLTANVAEADIGSVTAGQAAQVTLTAAGAGVEGTVTRVSPEGTTSNNVVQYPVTVALSSAPEGARLGASAGVTITTGSASDVLTLQSSAITTLGSRHTVSVVRNGVPTVVPVEVGLVGGGLTEITSGLTQGETVSLPSTTTSGTGGLPGFAPGLGGGGRP
jgi:multidrug efflux pump subunit AcrA (membrane-fusion protein)